MKFLSKVILVTQDFQQSWIRGWMDNNWIWICSVASIAYLAFIFSVSFLMKNRYLLYKALEKTFLYNNSLLGSLMVYAIHLHFGALLWQSSALLEHSEPGLNSCMALPIRGLDILSVTQSKHLA